MVSQLFDGLKKSLGLGDKGSQATGEGHRAGPAEPGAPSGGDFFDQSRKSGDPDPQVVVHENFFGIRTVHGRNAAALSPSVQPQNEIEKIQNEILRTFQGISRETLLKTAQELEWSENNEANVAKWRALRDRILTINKNSFKTFDFKKDEDGAFREAIGLIRAKLGGQKPVREGSFRRLSNNSAGDGSRNIWNRLWKPDIQYKSGAKGIGQRFLLALLPWRWIKTWWELFDSFFYGYYRRNLAAEFSRRSQDFLGSKAEGFLLQEMRALHGHVKFSERLRTSNKYRSIFESVPGRLIWALGQSTVEFMTRRLITAVLSAVVVGVMAHLALPGLAVAGVAGAAQVSWLNLSLVNVHGIGGILVWISHLIANLASTLLGDRVGGLVADTLGVFLGELKFGSMINTAFLSLLIAFPQAHEQRMREIHGANVKIHGLASKEGWIERFQTIIDFRHPILWKKAAGTFKGMMLVGAEIHMAIGSSNWLDAGLNKATGNHLDLHPFYRIGSFVDGDPSKHKTGAISWGSILLDKAQNAIPGHWNISDAVFHGLNGANDPVKDNSALSILLMGAKRTSDGKIAPAATGGIAAAVYHAVVTPHEHQDGAGIDVQNVGDWNQELAQSQEHLKELQARLDYTRRDLGEMTRQDHPLSPAESAAHDKAVQELQKSRARAYIESKLAQMHDLKNPKPEEAAEMQRLLALEKELGPMLPPPGENTGRKDHLSIQVADLKALLDRAKQSLKEPLDRKAVLGTGAALDDKVVDEISKKVAELEIEVTRAKGDLAAREAQTKLLSLANEARNKDLWERRNGKVIMSVHEGIAKQATLVDATFALQEIASAEKVIMQAQALVDQKMQAVQQTLQADQQAAANALQNQQSVKQWTSDANTTVNQDKSQQSDLVTRNNEAQSVIAHVNDFEGDLKALLSQMDAQDSNGSANALAEYQRRQALLPTLVQWKTNGKPGDTSYQNLKDFQDKLKTAQDDLQKMKDGLNKIQNPNNPSGFGGIAIALVPGIPDPGISNYSGVSKGTLLNMLAARKTYWQGQLSDYQSQLKDVNDRLTSNGRMETDDFGDTHPYSLPVWLDQDNKNIAQYKQTLQAMISGDQGIDALAQQINAVSTGGKLPMLSGLGLTDLENTLQDYPDKLSAVSFPSDDTDALFQVKMKLLVLGKMLPHAARTTIFWAKADAEVTTIQKTLSDTLTPVRDSLVGIINAIQAPQNSNAPCILTDIDADVAFLNLSNPTATQSDAIYGRKTALLQTLEPAVQSAADAIQNKLIPFQNDAIKSVQPGGDQYAKLFNTEVTLYTSIQKALGHTVAWALAADGAKDGDIPGALASIASEQKTYQNYLTTYDDASGHHEGLLDVKQDIADRLAKNGGRTETLYGETQPYSLYDKIAKYGVSGEMTQKANQWNSYVGDVIKILTEMDQLTAANKDPRNLLSRFTLPAKIGTDDASIAQMQKLVDDSTLQNLGDELKKIADKYKTIAGTPSLGSVASAAAPPTGNQPSPTVNAATQIALLADQAAARIVPSYQQKDAASAPLANALIRYQYSHAVVKAANDGLNNQIPVAQKFVTNGIQSLNDALTDLGTDQKYVNGQSGETPDQVIARKLKIFAELRDFTAAGVTFLGQKTGWDLDTLNNTVPQINTYYDSLNKAYQNGVTLANAELDAGKTMKTALQNTFNDLETQRIKLQNWKTQIDDRRGSALAQMGEVLRSVQDTTRKLLQTNINYHLAETQYKYTSENLKWDIGQVETKQHELQELVNSLPDSNALPGDLAAKIETLTAQNGIWMLGANSPDAAQAIVVHKDNLPFFIDRLFSVFRNQLSGMTQDQFSSRILANPQSLTDLIPNSGLVDFSNNADGFYLLYDTNLSIPNGVGYGHYVTAGNIGHFLGNNISVSGYETEQPSNVRNAAYGDRGADVQIESLQGQNWISITNIALHRFPQDAPADLGALSSAGESRVFIMNDSAIMLMDGKLYLAGTGYGDWAAADRDQRAAFYGGSAKASVQLTPIMQLTAEQQAILIKDPRTFLENINLDFTGFDSSLNQNFPITAQAQNKSYYRTTLGPTINARELLNKLTGSDSKDQFTIDLYWSRQSGTDDYKQQAGGVSVLNGFTIKGSDDKPLAVISNRATGEVGQKYNTVGDRVSVTLPKSGIAFTGEGQLIGGAETYYAEVSKPLDKNSKVLLGYGDHFVGENKRLVFGLENHFTLSDVWGKVSHDTKEQMAGGGPLKKFNAEMKEYLEGQAPNSQIVNDLKDAFYHDVGIKLLSEESGSLSREIGDLRKAGSVFSNSRVRNMIGFASKPANKELITRALAGGPTSGSQADFQLTKENKALIQRDIFGIYQDGLKLQGRMSSLTQDLMMSVEEIAEAQWEVRLAMDEAQKAPLEVGRKEGEARLAAAQARWSQAKINYNMLTGRAPGSALPKAFDDIKTGDLQVLISELKKDLAAPDRLVEILHRLDPKELQQAIGPDVRDWFDYVPWVDHLTLTVGLQLQDLMASQQYGAGVTVELPIFDPASKTRNQGYKLQGGEIVEQMQQAYRQYALEERREELKAEFLANASRVLQPEAQQSWENLNSAITGYEKGDVAESELREAFAEWRWTNEKAVESAGKGAMAEVMRSMDAVLKHKPSLHSGGKINSIDEAFKEASSYAPNLKEITYRIADAEQIRNLNAHRIQRIAVDISVGGNLTESGLGFLPRLAMNGAGISPIMILDFKPTELAVLDRQKSEAEMAMYNFVKQKAEFNLAVELFQNSAIFKQSQEAADQLEREVLPLLKSRLAQAEQSGSETAAAQARWAVGHAQFELGELRVAHKQAAATVNYLLGRSPADPLEIGFSVEDGLDRLKQIVGQIDPVAVQRGILDKNIERTRAEEITVEKDLGARQIATEPMAIIPKGMGELISALSSRQPGDPEKVAAAQIQAIQAERAKEVFDAELPAKRADLLSQLNFVREEIVELQKKPDPESRLKSIELTQKKYLIEASLAALGGETATTSPEFEGGKGRGAPSSFAELKDRIESAYLNTADPGNEPAMEPPGPVRRNPDYASHLRYYFYHESLARDLTNVGFLEGWLEVRLRNPDTPPDILLKLAKLRTEKADLFRTISAAKAKSKGDLLIAQFSSDVRQLRMLDWESRNPGTSSAQNFGKSRQEITRRLQVQRDQITALLGLPADTTWENLARLVPENLGGSESKAVQNFQDVADQTIAEIRGANISSLQRQFSVKGFPRDFANQESLMNKLRSDTIARRFSYKGFTPEMVWGVFHQSKVGGFFLDIPDPRQIEDALSRTLPQALVKELAAKGELDERTRELQLLMQGVLDEMKLVERERDLVTAAEEHFRAVAEERSRGIVSQEDFLSAQDGLADSWGKLTHHVAELQSNFATLVTELEAIGMGDKGDKSGIGHAQDPLDRQPDHSDIDNRILRFASRRMVDPGFVSKIDSALADKGLADSELRKNLTEAARLYAQANQESGKMDPEVPRREIERLLGDLRSTGAWTEVLKILSHDLETEVQRSEISRSEEIQFGEKIRAGYLHAISASPAVEGAFLRLDALFKERQAAQQALLEDFMTGTMEPTDFVLRDIALDRYLKAQQAFDTEAIKAFESEGLKKDPAGAQALIGIYDLGAIIARQKDWTRYGRGIGAIDALIMLEENRLAAMNYGKASPDEREEAALQIANLGALRSRWMSHDWGLSPLYAVTQVDSQGRRMWTVDGWHTQAQIDQWKVEKKISEEQGRMYLIDGSGVRKEILSGLDLAESNRDAAREAYERNAKDREVYNILGKNDFALKTLDGDAEKGIDYQDLIHLREQGRVYYFDGSADQNSRHPAVHPMLAQNSSVMPDIYVYDPAGVAAPPAREQFPTREGLEEYLARLRNSELAKDHEELSRFHRLAIGESGIKAMMDSEKVRQDAHLRKGWMSVKMGSVGFAMDDNGISDIYLTPDEFKSMLHSMQDAPQRAARARDALKAAEAQLEKAKGTGEANKTFHEAEGRIKEKLAPEVRKGLKQGKNESTEEFSRRIDTEVELKLVQDPDYQKARKAFNDQVRSYMKKGETLDVLEHRVDNAKKEIRDADDQVERSRHIRLFETRDLALSLDGKDNIVRVEGKPTFGQGPVDERIGEEKGPTRVLRGEVYKAVMDETGRLLRFYTDPADVDRTAGDDALVSVDGAPVLQDEEGNPLPQGKGAVAVNPSSFRLLYYEDVQSKEPVMLNRRYMIERASEASRRLTHTNHWAYQWFNLPNILEELPVGMVRNSMAVLTGADTRQNHYLGRAYMHKLEGGVTDHHGLVHRTLDHFDILDIGPDPVQWAFDPSQLPQSVEVKSILPGKNWNDHPGRVGKQDVNFGTRSLERTKTYDLEDLTNYKERILGYFRGDVENVFIETRHGNPVRAKDGTFKVGSYQTSSIVEGVKGRDGKPLHGQAAIERALKDPALFNRDIQGKEKSRLYEGDGVVMGDENASPGHMAVGQVRRQIKIHPGAKQNELAQKGISGFARSVEKAREGVFSRDIEQLRRDRETAGKGVDAANAQRTAGLNQEKLAWGAASPLLWRKGKQDAVRDRIRRDREEIPRLEAAIAQVKSRIRDLESRISLAASISNPVPAPQSDVSEPAPEASHWWSYLNPLYWIRRWRN